MKTHNTFVALISTLAASKPAAADCYNRWIMERAPVLEEDPLNALGLHPDVRSLIDEKNSRIEDLKERVRRLEETKWGKLEHLGAEAISKRFHELYEEMAPKLGYSTRMDTRAWDPRSPNGSLMIAVVERILPEIIASVNVGSDQPVKILHCYQSMPSEKSIYNEALEDAARVAECGTPWVIANRDDREKCAIRIRSMKR